MATDAITARNATASPLLRLPAEIRDNILTLVVGGQLLHIKAGEDGSIFSSICVAQNSKDQAYETLRTSRKEISPENGPSSKSVCLFRDSGAQYHCEKHAIDPLWTAYIAGLENVACGERHSKCDPFSGMSLGQEGSRETLHTPVLGVCRQIYNEGTPIVWSTNTFSFDDGRSFEDFVAVKLSSTQRAKILKLHIRVTIIPQATIHWRKALRSDIIDSLQGVRTLHICFDHDVTHGGFLQQIFDNLTSAIHSEHLTKPFLRLQVWPLRHATVVFSDNAHLLNNKSGGPWTPEQKRTAADSFRRKLLHPTEEERLKAKKEAYEAGQISKTILEIRNHRLLRR